MGLNFTKTRIVVRSLHKKSATKSPFKKTERFPKGDSIAL